MCIRDSVKPITEPTDKSIPPINNTMVIPKAHMLIAIVCSIRFPRFFRVRNALIPLELAGERNPKKITATTRIVSAPNCGIF